MQTMTDTPPEIAEMVRTWLMARSGAERLRLGVEMFEVARRMVLASLPVGLSDMQQKQQLCQRIYGAPLPDSESRPHFSHTPPNTA